MNTPTTIEKLVRGAFTAYANKDREAIEALLAPDFHFTSPLDNRIDRKERFRNSEVHTVRGSQIVEIEVYFGWSIPHPVKAGKHKG